MLKKIFVYFVYCVIIIITAGFKSPSLENDFEFLTELEPEYKSVGFGELGEGVYSSSTDPIVKGETIAVSGKSYPHGLFAPAPSVIKYDLNGDYSSISGSILLHDGVQCGNGVLFSIKVDGTLKFASSVPKPGGYLKTYEVDLKNAQEIELIVSALDNEDCDWSIWGDPVLTKAGVKKTETSLTFKIEAREPTKTIIEEKAVSAPDKPLVSGDIVVREDFDDEKLEPKLVWENFNPKKCNFLNKGFVGFIGEPDSLLHNNKQSNLLWYPLPDGEYTITVHLSGIFKKDFQQAAIFLYEDPNNYVTINRAFCSLCPTGGNGFFMNYKNGGAFNEYAAKTDKDDVYLRLENKNKVISGYYATEPDQWIRLGRISAEYTDFKKAGFGVTNDGTFNNASVRLDYFEISIP